MTMQKLLLLHLFKTAPDDYANVEDQHTFTPGGATRQCSNIQINSDEIVEGSESFSAGLQSTTDILESPTNALVIIIDNSSKTLVHHLCIIDLRVNQTWSQFLYIVTILYACYHAFVSVRNFQSLCFVLTVLTLQLDQAEYNIPEGIILRVCVVVASGETERPVSFQITPGGGSASGI